MRRPTLLALCLFACSKPGGRPPDHYEGCATDENWQALDDFQTTGRVTLDPQRAPRWLEPAPGATIPPASPPTFRWQPSPTDSGSATGNASCPDRCVGCRLSPMHLPPVSGNVFDLQIYAGGVLVYRLVTTLQRFTPAADLWAGWAGRELALDLVGAALLRNEVASGPFRSEALRVRVAP